MFKQWSKWTLNEWLFHLEHQHSEEIQLGLERIALAAQKLDLDRPDFKVITVAGTNGKGSTVSALETIYHHAGYQVGSYTSPHLIHFNERIRLGLTPISDDDLCAAFQVIEEGREELHLTYFETATLAALWYFKKQNIDIAVLEVGLGGRFDATNIVDADLAIITTIDYDHQHFLGDTREAIGFEKAGILRAGKPFIYADSNPPQSIIDRANTLQTSSYYYDQDYFIDEGAMDWTWRSSAYQLLALVKPKIQLKSAAAAILACRLLAKEYPVAEQHVYQAMESVFIPGRLQLQPGHIDILYDVSHNSQSACLLASTIKQMNRKGAVHAVFSALQDKDILGLISPLKDCVTHWYPAQLDNKRAASAEMLLSTFKDAEIFVNICYTSPLIAFERALKHAVTGDLIVVFGSFFTVSHVMIQYVQ